MQAIILILLILIVGYNLIINLTNMTIIVKYCMGTNSLNEYWNLYFKHCFSFRAIYSSIFGLILALILFFILIPIILIRSVMYKGKMKEYVETGFVFKYDDSLELPANTEFYSNCNDYGFSINRVAATGSIANDIENVLHAMITFGEQNAIEIKYDIMKEIYILSKNESVYAPLNLFKQEINYPVYFIYDDSQIAKYKNVKQALSETGFKETIYFSVKNF